MKKWLLFTGVAVWRTFTHAQLLHSPLYIKGHHNKMVREYISVNYGKQLLLSSINQKSLINFNLFILDYID